MKKRIIKIFLSYIILILIIVGIIFIYRKDLIQKDDKLNIVVTLYPEYDFVKNIVGDRANISMLLDAGVEAHTYEPSAQDMKEIIDSDLFFYTNDSMEPWVKNISNSIDSNCQIINVSKGINLINLDKFMEEYSLIDNEDEEHSNEDYNLDGHVWLDVSNAMKMLDNIYENIIKIDSDNINYYKENYKNYRNKLENLDFKIEKELSENNIDTLVFGGEFSYAYFCKRYNLKVISAYTSCGEGSEPSVIRVKNIIDYINKNSVSNVFYEELSQGTVANMISEETSSKAEVFNTLHNVSWDEINSGKNYISIMEENLEKIIKD